MRTTDPDSPLRHARLLPALALAALACACVTVNVYFPAAAAENAADLFVKEVYGESAEPAPAGKEAPAPAAPPPGEPSSEAARAAAGVIAALLDVLVPPAHAQEPAIDIATPAITTLKSAMTARHGRLEPHYATGAIGMAATGLLSVRDAKAIGLRDRAAVNQLVADENRDRNALYAEVAKANGHPEWEPRIREIFARRWVANAPGGWWYQDATGWQRK